jgi:hypothetical protein
VEVVQQTRSRSTGRSTRSTTSRQLSEREMCWPVSAVHTVWIPVQSINQPA